MFLNTRYKWIWGENRPCYVTVVGITWQAPASVKAKTWRGGPFDRTPCFALNIFEIASAGTHSVTATRMSCKEKNILLKSEKLGSFIKLLLRNTVNYWVKYLKRVTFSKGQIQL